MVLVWFFLVLVGCTVSTVVKLRVMRVQMSNEPGSGMDSNIFFGGDFHMTICSKDDCCQTGTLGTNDDNWELGEQNFFIGRQLGGCEDHPMRSDQVRLTVHHSGSDGGKIEWVKLRGALRNAHQVQCTISRKLSWSQSTTVDCVSLNTTSGSGCNGSPDFCSLRFNEVTFPGTHNSGTGQRDLPVLGCWYKNHDLNVVEQLDFGIRFLDFDITYSTSLNCNGLETGHGFHKAVYVCFGKVEEILEQLKRWMNQNPSEVVVVHFGKLENFDQSYLELKRVISSVFKGHQGINMQFQTSGVWPTLREAVDSNNRLFIMVRIKEPQPYNGEAFVKVVKVSSSSTNLLDLSAFQGVVSIASTFTTGGSGRGCRGLIQTTRHSCKSLAADLMKLSSYGRMLSRSGVCLDSVARQCNPLTPQLVKQCKQHKSIINFIFSDYPNYMSKSRYSLPEIADFESNITARKASAEAI